MIATTIYQERNRFINMGVFVDLTFKFIKKYFNIFKKNHTPASPSTSNLGMDIKQILILKKIKISLFCLYYIIF